MSTKKTQNGNFCLQHKTNVDEETVKKCAIWVTVRYTLYKKSFKHNYHLHCT